MTLCDGGLFFQLELVLLLPRTDWQGDKHFISCIIISRLTYRLASRCVGISEWESMARVRPWCWV
jgi:hypothetical protein